MDYKCPLCNESIKDDLLVYIDHTQEHIVDEIKAKHPDWVEKEGVCPKCVEYFKAQLKGEDLDPG